MVDKDTKLFISVSSRPGSLGAKVYHELFAKYSVNAIYIPRKAPATASELIAAIKTLNISGCSVSMPLKSEVVTKLDRVDELATQINSVNTIVEVKGALHGFNTDYIGVEQALKDVKPGRVLVAGNGGVLGAVVTGLRNLGAQEISLVTRSFSKGESAAKRFGLNFIGDYSCIKSDGYYDVVINATSVISLAEGEWLSKFVSVGKVLFDLNPLRETAALTLANQQGKPAIGGLVMYCHQVQKQFWHYTGISPELKFIENIVYQ